MKSFQNKENGTDKINGESFRFARILGLSRALRIMESQVLLVLPFIFFVSTLLFTKKKKKMKISEQLWPRVVVLITSTNKKENIMTASFVMPISFSPKYVAIAIAPTRETLKNIKETKEFGLNVCEESMLEKAKICGSFSGKTHDKFSIAQLTKEKGKIIKAPLIKEAPVSLECKLEYMKKFGDHFLVVGKVVSETIRKENFRPLLHKTQDIFPRIK